MPKRAVKRGPLTSAEGGRRKLRNSALRAAEHKAYLKAVRERAEWCIAMLRFCEAMNWPIVFRKADLIALRK